MNQDNPQQKKSIDTFVLLAKVLLLFTVGFILLSTGARLVANTVWPQKLFIDFFRSPLMIYLSVLTQSQPLFSPVLVAICFSLTPLFLHLGCLWILSSITRPWKWSARGLYFFIALVPVFGPFAAWMILQSIGGLED